MTLLREEETVGSEGMLEMQAPGGMGELAEMEGTGFPAVATWEMEGMPGMAGMEGMEGLGEPAVPAETAGMAAPSQSHFLITVQARPLLIPEVGVASGGVAGWVRPEAWPLTEESRGQEEAHVVRSAARDKTTSQARQVKPANQAIRVAWGSQA